MYTRINVVHIPGRTTKNLDSLLNNPKTHDFFVVKTNFIMKVISENKCNHFFFKNNLITKVKKCKKNIYLKKLIRSD